MIKRSLLLAAFAIVAIVPAHAEYFTHYVVTMTGPLAVDGIVKWEKIGPDGGGASWPDFVNGGSVNYLNQVFGSLEPRTAAFFMGVSYDGYTQAQLFDQSTIPASGQHLVMFLSNGARDQLVGQDFEAMFPGFTESVVIGWLEAVGQIGTPPLDEATFNADFDGLSSLVQYADSTYGAYFDLPPNQLAVSGQFSVVQFSNGEQVGTGSVAQESVPEPGTLSTAMLAGFGLVALRRRHRKA